jgi:peptide deformylase
MPKAMKVLQEPDKILRQVAKPVPLGKLGTPEFLALIEDMEVTMKKEKGVGLAAPQIGISWRLFIAETPEGNKTFVNPEFVKKSFKIIDYEEGCLSVRDEKKKGTWGKTRRHRSVTVKALDAHGKEFEMRGDGLLSIIFQHEIDHLDGVLFIDHATDLWK